MPKPLPRLFLFLPPRRGEYPNSSGLLRAARLIVARRSSGRYLYLQFRDRARVRNLFIASIRQGSPDPVLPTRAEGTA
jgi:hypothetical protein